MHSTLSHTRQWCNLLALTVAHTVADIYVGMISPVLIPMRDRYDVSLAALVFIASLLAFSSNVFQIPIGHMKATWTRPWMICGGVLLAGLSAFIPCLQPGPCSMIGMAVIALLAGLGVATVHPEGLRAVHGLDKIPSALATAVFMVGGFLGFAGGALLASSITEHFGLTALAWLYLLAPLASVPLIWSGVRLPIETAETRNAEVARTERGPAVPFVPLFVIASVLATSSQIQAILLPSYLHDEAGYSLSFSGLSFTLFGLGGATGAILWGALAPRLGHLRVLMSATLAGTPLTLLYLWLAPQTKYAIALLSFTGFIVYTGFPLCVALARDAASGLRLSQRMGWISGGTWGIAAMALWIIGPVADKIGFRLPLHLTWIGYLVAATMICAQMRKTRS